MSEKSEKAANVFNSGFNCAQSVLSSFIEETGLNRDMALRITAGLGGGMGRMQHTCGAVTGACLVIGALCGSEDAGNEESREKTIGLTRKFLSAFTDKHGSVNCKELIGYDLNSEEELMEAGENKVFETKCAAFVKTAVALLENELAGLQQGKRSGQT